MKVISIFAQWVCGPQVVLYKWVWSKLPNYSMIFWPKMHDFRSYMTTVHWPWFFSGFNKLVLTILFLPEVKSIIFQKSLICMDHVDLAGDGNNYVIMSHFWLEFEAVWLFVDKIACVHLNVVCNYMERVRVFSTSSSKSDTLLGQKL